MYLKQLAFQKLIIITSFFVISCSTIIDQNVTQTRPNILFFITDDQSWIHNSFAGEQAIKTPGFDSVAREGIYFENAFCAAPSCSPSRGAIITGQEIWRLGEAAQLFSAVPKELSKSSFPLLLEANGYYIGYTQKGWEPNNFKTFGWEKYPLGSSFNDHKTKPLTNGIVKNDYFSNFKAFLSNKEDTKPFFFWCGTSEPHRAFEKGSGIANAIDPNKIFVPGFLPDVPEIRSDIADYLLEIKWTDQHLEKMIALLEQRGILENTLIIVTSDNGMAFPAAKATLNEYGIHIPLAIRWDKGIKSAGRSTDVMVSLTDLAPTILEVAETTIPPNMTGKSLMDIFKELKTKERNYAFSAKERHTICRASDLPYPQRAVRDRRFLYIRNFEPNRWPAGSPTLKSSHGWTYGDIDQSPSFNYLKKYKSKAAVKKYFLFATAKKPSEELYDITIDPQCQKNLIHNDEYKAERSRLSKVLTDYLIETEDPRVILETSPWDNYPYYFNNPKGITPFPFVQND